MEVDPIFDTFFDELKRANAARRVRENEKPKSPYDVREHTALRYGDPLPPTLYDAIKYMGLVASNLHCNVHDDLAITEQCVRQYAAEYEPQYQEMLHAINHAARGGTIYRGIKTNADDFFKNLHRPIGEYWSWDKETPADFAKGTSTKGVMMHGQVLHPEAIDIDNTISINALQWKFVEKEIRLFPNAEVNITEICDMDHKSCKKVDRILLA